MLVKDFDTWNRGYTDTCNAHTRALEERTLHANTLPCSAATYVMVGMTLITRHGDRSFDVKGDEEQKAEE